MTESLHLERLSAVLRYVRVSFLHYARGRRPVKELYRFRQVRRAAFVHRLDERISPAHCPIKGLSFYGQFALSPSLHYNSHPNS